MGFSWFFFLAIQILVFLGSQTSPRKKQANEKPIGQIVVVDQLINGVLLFLLWVIFMLDFNSGCFSFPTLSQEPNSPKVKPLPLLKKKCKSEPNWWNSCGVSSVDRKLFLECWVLILVPSLFPQFLRNQTATK